MRYHFLFLALTAIVGGSFAHAEVPGLTAPAGFEVARFAGDDLATDIQAMTIDGAGRIVVSGPGYIKRLIDDDGDGRADRAELISDQIKTGAMGLCFIGRDLYCTGNNALLKLRNADIEGRGAAEPLVIVNNLKFGEHGPHAILQGPDGWIYLICGNNTGVTGKNISSRTSPVREPQAGTILRFSPDFKESEVIAHGFRNAYDFDFNLHGNLFTFDSDGERDTHLPWYCATRIYDVAPGMHHGWVDQPGQRSWSRPAEWFDNVPRLAELGRGSPTGVTVYRHRQFPAPYRDGLFACCWTLGRVYFLPLKRDAASYQAKPETFLQTTGQVGFAPTDLCVGPDGSLYVAIGGRRTQGSVFRIRWTGEAKQQEAPPDRLSADVRTVVDADQPLEAWSRAKWQPAAARVKAEELEQILLSQEPRYSTARQIRAIEALTQLHGQVRYEVAEEVSLDKATDPEVLARLAWSLGRKNDIRNRIFLAAQTGHQDPRVARAAWEGWHGTGKEDFPPEWTTLISHRSRRVRAACLLADTHREIGPKPEATALPRELLAWAWRKAARGQLTPSIGAACALSWESFDSSEMKLEVLRLVELSLGDVRVDNEVRDLDAGYAPRLPPDASLRQAMRALVAHFPTGDLPVDREMARVCGMIALDDQDLLARWPKVFRADSRAEDDLHFLICLARLPGKRALEVTRATAAALAGLHPKLQANSQFPGRNWPLRLGDVTDRLIDLDPNLPQAILADERFRLPSQSLLGLRFNREKQDAARKLLAVKPKEDEELRWTSDMVALVASLPPAEAQPALRSRWEDYSLRDTIIRYLAKAPERADRPLLAETLETTGQVEVLIAAAEGLAKLPGPLSADERFATMVALQQHASQAEHVAVRRELIALLTLGTGEKLRGDDPATADTDARPWLAWYAKAHPVEAKRLVEFTGGDLTTWLKRAEAIAWDQGDAERGRIAFEKRACFRCHGGTTRFGPDLTGVSGRLSRHDLLAAIVDPSREVSPAFQSMRVETASGKAVVGMLVYESPEAMLVQSAPDTTTRIAGEEITSVRPIRQSPMPVGLLNGAKDEEIADLLAYLATLKK